MAVIMTVDADLFLEGSFLICNFWDIGGGVIF